MGKMKKLSLILFFALLLNNNSFTQSDSMQKVKLPILRSNSTLFEKLLEDIVTYESKHCFIAVDRSYYIKMESVTSIITISSKRIDKALNIAYGVFYIDEHVFLVNDVSMDSFFFKTQNNMEFLKKNKDIDDSLLVIDDTQTVWKFLFTNGHFQFEWFEGQCDDYMHRISNPLERREYEYIDIIEEKVDDFPDLQLPPSNQKTD